MSLLSRRVFRAFLADSRGVSAIVIAIVLPLLLAIAGGVIDIGRHYTTNARAQAALDAAFLGAYAELGSTSDPNFRARLTELFKANFKDGYLGANTINGSSFTIGSDYVTLNFDSASTITKVIGINTQGTKVTSKIAIGYKTIPGAKLELALVLDNTGSMRDLDTSGAVKIDALKTAATNLVNKLFSDAAALDNLHISLVPYDIAVQIGAGRSSWMQSQQLYYSQKRPNPSHANPLVDNFVTGQTPTPEYNTPLAVAGWCGSAAGCTNYIPQWYDGAGPIFKGSKNKYDWLVQFQGKGFAMNRENDILCGPYYIGEYRPAVPGGTYCGTCGYVRDPNDVSGEGTIYQCSGTSPCVTYPGNPADDTYGKYRYFPSCNSADPSNYQVGALKNNYTDISDDPPTSPSNPNDPDSSKFRLPYEVQTLPYTPGSGAKIPDGGNGNTYAYSESGGYIYTGNVTAYTTELAPMLFAGSVKQDILNAVNNMKPSGATRINVGLMWGWFTLSPKWKGVWDSTGNTADYPADVAPLQTKAIVLMTDGQNYYVPGATYPGNDDVKTKALCDAIKDHGQHDDADVTKKVGITIYTVGFGSGNQLNDALLEDCASVDPKDPNQLKKLYFKASNRDELDDAFQKIVDNILIQTLRLTK